MLEQNKTYTMQILCIKRTCVVSVCALMCAYVHICICARVYVCMRMRECTCVCIHLYGLIESPMLVVHLYGEENNNMHYTAKTTYKYGTQRNPSHSVDTGENGIRYNTVTHGNCILLVTCCHGNPWFT